MMQFINSDISNICYIECVQNSAIYVIECICAGILLAREQLRMRLDFPGRSKSNLNGPRVTQRH